MSENGEIYTAGKNFTLPPGVTGVTNSTSGADICFLEGMLMLLESIKGNLCNCKEIVFKFCLCCFVFICWQYLLLVGKHNGRCV